MEIAKVILCVVLCVFVFIGARSASYWLFDNLPYLWNRSHDGQFGWRYPHEVLSAREIDVRGEQAYLVVVGTWRPDWDINSARCKSEAYLVWPAGPIVDRWPSGGYVERSEALWHFINGWHNALKEGGAILGDSYDAHWSFQIRNQRSESKAKALKESGASSPREQARQEEPRA